MSGAKPDEHLNWSTHEPDFLYELQEQPIRQMVFQQIKDDFVEKKFCNILEVGFGGASQYKKMESFF